jgi:RNA-directed DNA polymerase
MDKQLLLFGEKSNEESLALEDLFQAYEDCRKNKRSKQQALAFEIDYEDSISDLWEKINQGSYEPSISHAFIVKKPVKREVFAALFHDRIVHHLIINKLNPLFEKVFIHDSYACREGKGTSFGIKRVDSFIRKCSKNYTHDAYVLKLDVQGFFMHINKRILWDSLKIFILDKYHHKDRWILLSLCEKVIFYDPVENCTLKSSKQDWKDLPLDKSLFYAKKDCGLPIGNLTSQVFANFYMNSFDHYMKKELGIYYYGRYVDDFVVVANSKENLKELIPKIAFFLEKNLELTLHPKKIYLQHYSKGIAFLGAFIKPHRIYAGHRTKQNFKEAVLKSNQKASSGYLNSDDKCDILSSVNSYLGLMRQFKTYRLRKMIMSKLTCQIWSTFYTNVNLEKLIVK